MDDAEEFAVCCSCGRELPERAMYAATVGGLYQCRACYEGPTDEWDDEGE